MHSDTIRDDLCVVCTHNYSEDHSHSPTALKCGHVFGRSCIVEWGKINRSCPLCRQRFATPKALPDTTLITEIQKQFNSNKFPYSLLAGASYLYNPNTIEIAGWAVLVGVFSLGTFGVIRACNSTANLIRGCLGWELSKPMQLREIKPHFIMCCSAIISGSIAAKLTSNPQHGYPDDGSALTG